MNSFFFLALFFSCFSSKAVQRAHSFALDVGFNTTECVFKVFYYVHDLFIIFVSAVFCDLEKISS